MKEGQHADHNTPPKRLSTTATSIDKISRTSPAFNLQSRSTKILPLKSHQHASHAEHPRVTAALVQHAGLPLTQNGTSETFTALSTDMLTENPVFCRSASTHQHHAHIDATPSYKWSQQQPTPQAPQDEDPEQGPWTVCWARRGKNRRIHWHGRVTLV